MGNELSVESTNINPQQLEILKNDVMALGPPVEVNEFIRKKGDYTYSIKIAPSSRKCFINQYPKTSILLYFAGRVFFVVVVVVVVVVVCNIGIMILCSCVPE